jgi:hypothetical protein
MDRECRRCVIEKSDCEIEVAITAGGRVEVKDKRGQAERRKVEHKWRPSALFEENEEADE